MDWQGLCSKNAGSRKPSMLTSITETWKHGFDIQGLGTSTGMEFSGDGFREDLRMV